MDVEASIEQVTGILVREGERFVFKATKPGTISYVCIFHPGMTGTIDVSN